ncbi:MAG: hypothetical protein SO141_00315 [Alphaproteobacteria bacterium]|nr:hypothetical protein [Alphaproteobacteria bacterium]
MAKNAKIKMGLNEAIAVLQGETMAMMKGVDGFSRSKIQDALKIVKEQDPDNPILKAYLQQVENFEKANNLQSNDAEVYDQNSKDAAFSLNGYTFDKFTADKNNKDIAGYIDNAEVTDSESGKVLEGQERKDYLSLIFEGAKLKAETSLSGNEDFAKMKKAEKIKVFKAEVKTIFFADFARSAIASELETPTTLEQRVGTKEYKAYIMRQSQKASEVFQKIVDGGKKIKIKTDAILASCADTAAQTEQYIKGLRLKAQQLAANAAQSAKNGAQKASDNIRNDFNKIADRLQKHKNNFEQLANNVSKNRYEIFKNIKGSFSDNKIKLFGNVAANAAFGYWTAAVASGAVAGATAPVLVPAVAAYAVYHAAGSWVYPVVAEVRKINRKKREAGEPTLPFKQALKQAWKNKMDSRKDKRTYIISGVVNTALAAGGLAWLKDGLEAADAAATLTDGVKDGLNVTLASSIAETRHAISMGRAGAATMAQLADAGVAYGVSVADPENLEKKAEAKQTAIAALVGMGFNAAFQGIGFARGHNASSDVLSPEVETPAPAVNDAANDTANEASSAPKNGFFKGLWSKMFGANEADNASTALASNPAGSDVNAPNPANVDEAPEVESNAPAEAAQPETAETDNMTGLFPKEYNKDMGISETQYNTLVKTTEGTLKAATGEEITLDRAYSNLNSAMDNFEDKTKEEIMYKYNRLYAFMRKAYNVGDGTLRETPSGREYLTSRFSNISISGMNDEKMTQLVNYAMENTYADKAELKDGLNNLFPEGLSNKDMTSLVTAIHSNQRFNQYQSEMEALTKLLGCGEQINAEQAKAINNMLDNTDALLATGKAHTQLTGLSLAKDCHDDDGEWKYINVEPKEVPVPAVPELGDVELPADEPIAVEPTTIELQPDDDLQIKPMAYKAPEPANVPEPEPERNVKGVRKMVATKMSQFEGENKPDYEKVLDEKRTARMLRRHKQDIYE